MLKTNLGLADVSEIYYICIRKTNHAATVREPSWKG